MARGIWDITLKKSTKFILILSLHYKVVDMDNKQINKNFR